MNADSIRAALREIAGNMDEARDRLIELDQQIGDGDLGISMAKGFAAAAAASQGGEEDVGRLLTKCGMEFNEAAPSTLGTILCFGFMGMGKALRGKTEASFCEFAGAFAQGVENIMQKAKSQPGEKTILDSLCPAADAYALYADDPAKAVRLAAEAAKAGSDATKDMAAAHGRAARYPGGSVGFIDGGSVVGWLIADGICKAAGKAGEKG